jgi:DNA-binding NarL/FixJ family response regulator
MIKKPASAMKPITVLLADDHTIVREGLRTLLEAEGDIKVIGEAANGREAVELAERLRPDVLVMDIAMPGLNGLEAIRQIRKAMPEAKLLILSAHSDDVYVEQVIALGALGYLVKQASAHVLSMAVREVHKGNAYFSPALLRRLESQSPKVSKASRRRGHPSSRVSRLSSREVEVLQLIAEGQANKQVAAELRISVKTVEKHRQRLMEKLGIHDTAGLTRYAITVGIIESSVQLTIV